MLKEIFDKYIFLDQVTFRVIAKINGTGIQKGTLIPDISNLQIITLSNIAPVTIINFTGGIQYHPLKILGDGQTTIKNNTTIKTNTGADKLLAVNKIYRFTLIDEIWYEDA